MIDRLLAKVRAAASLLTTEDARAARLLAQEKAAFRDLEQKASAPHFARLRAGRIETAATSALHFDALRDMERVSAHFVAAGAYPVLGDQSELLPSRLRDEE